MLHEDQMANTMEIEHFNPKLKGRKRHKYSNLFHACRYVNGKKHDNWPTKDELKLGVRFLNPCEELDYGGQIFENPKSNKLVGTSVAARYHIEICDLNAPFLVNKRKERTRVQNLLYKQQVKITDTSLNQSDSSFREALDYLKEHSGTMIPEIPPPPSY